MNIKNLNEALGNIDEFEQTSAAQKTYAQFFSKIIGPLSKYPIEHSTDYNHHYFEFEDVVIEFGFSDDKIYILDRSKGVPNYEKEEIVISLSDPQSVEKCRKIIVDAILKRYQYIIEFANDFGKLK